MDFDICCELCCSFAQASLNLQENVGVLSDLAFHE